jgi:hypothetical protein
MGYERKRGKLALLNSWLRHPGTQFVSVAEMPAHFTGSHKIRHYPGQRYGAPARYGTQTRRDDGASAEYA